MKCWAVRDRETGEYIQTRGGQRGDQPRLFNRRQDAEASMRRWFQYNGEVVEFDLVSEEDRRAYVVRHLHS